MVFTEIIITKNISVHDKHLILYNMHDNHFILYNIFVCTEQLNVKWNMASLYSLYIQLTGIQKSSQICKVNKAY